MGIFRKKKKLAITEERPVSPSANEVDENKGEAFSQVAPKNIGKLDMVIAFDTTGSMSQYIGAVRKEVSELIPQLFKDNEDLRLGIVAFGDYCDMNNSQDAKNGAKPPTKNGDTRSLFYHPVLVGYKDTTFFVLN